MCAIRIELVEPAAHPVTRPSQVRRLRHRAVAGILAMLLAAPLTAATAQAGQCSALAPVAQAPTFPVDRTGAADSPWRLDDSVPTSAIDAAAAPTAAAVTVTEIGRPTGPEVQPCRHLPAEQKIECLRRTAGTASSRR